MGIAANQVIAALSGPLPNAIVTQLVTEYQDIKQHFAFKKFRPSELNGGRFAECTLRLIQHIDNPPHTPLGTTLPQTDGIIRHAEGNTALPDALRFFIPRLSRILLDVRNRRDVAHPGGEVSPNFSDSVFTAHCADWILTELIRLFYQCSIDSAKKIVESLNETQIPLIADVDGFIRVQNTSLDVKEKCLAILYYKNPAKLRDADLLKWTRYANSTRFRSKILAELDAAALIHCQDGFCCLLPKGIAYTEKHVPLEILV